MAGGSWTADVGAGTRITIQVVEPPVEHCLMFAQFRSGDSAAGFAGLAAGMRDRSAWIYRLPCFAPLDEVRATSRYRAMLAQIGPMPAR